jgi:peptide deformylase
MKEWGGVGLAAPQVGFNIQLIVIDTRKNNRESRDGRRVTLFNPVITEMYGEQQVQEGCLSFPGQSFAKIRPMNVKVKYTTPDGAYMESWFEGLAAQVIIHEIFHLHGILLDNPTIDDVYCLLNKGEKDAE